MATMRYETGISENYVNNWGMVEVLKEIVQNVVYSKSILGDEISITHDGKYAIIKNTPHGFSKGKLLVGESGQRNVKGAPGCYGEGIKLAMLVARKLIKEFSFETTGFSVRPELEPSELDTEVNVLTLYITDIDENSGTTFKIECSEEDLNTAKSYFAILSGISEKITMKNKIFMDKPKDQKKNVIYVNGVKITDINSIFSYNFTNTELMNRDRSTVDLYAIQAHVARQLSYIKDVGMASIVIDSILQDDSLLESQSGILEISADTGIWKQALEMNFGKKVAISVGGQSDTQAMYKRFTLLKSIPYAWKYFFQGTLGIPETDNLSEVRNLYSNKSVKPIKSSSANLGWAKRYIKLYIGDYGKVKIAKAVYDKHQNKCDGLYDPEQDIIWITESILESKEETFKTLLHETLHKLTGADDNTEEFTQVFEDACYKILMRGRDK